MIYNKLVRDKIPEIIAREGKSVSFRALKGEELRKALKDKLKEEVNEFIKAETREQMIEEIADILEVVDWIRNKFSLQDFPDPVCEMQKTKRMEKGCFREGYFLEKVVDEVCNT